MVERYKLDKINDYLNSVFGEMKKYSDGAVFYYQDLINTMGLLYSTIEFKLTETEEDKTFRVSSYSTNTLTIMEINDLVIEILESIDKECNTNYADIFRKAIINGDLEYIFAPDEQDDDSYFDTTASKNATSYLYYPEKDEGIFKSNLMNITSNRSYQTVIDVIHEFFHYTNAVPGPSVSRDVLTEGISIYFEMYAMEYLLNNNKCGPCDVAPVSRVGFTMADIYRLEEYAGLICYFVDQGNLTEKSFEYIDERVCEMPEEVYAEMIDDVYNSLCYMEKEAEEEQRIELLEEQIFAEKEKKQFKFLDDDDYLAQEDENIIIDDQNKCESVRDKVVYKLKDKFSAPFPYFIGTMFACMQRKNGSIHTINYINKMLPKLDDLDYYYYILGIDMDKMRDEAARDDGFDALAVATQAILDTFRKFETLEEAATAELEEKGLELIRKR